MFDGSGTSWLLQEKLLAGLQAAGHPVLVGTAAAFGQAAVTAGLLWARDVDVIAAIPQQILPFANYPSWSVMRSSAEFQHQLPG